jgi:hypothetical protein
MNSLRILSVLPPGLALLLPLALFAQDNPGTITFSDPSKPGTVKISVGRGNLRVRGADTAEVTVDPGAKTERKAPRKDGLRVLTARAGFSLSESGNVVTLEAGLEGGWGGRSDLAVTVPRGANVVVSNSWGGDVVCSDLTGDLEIKCLQGEVKLERISGAALVETMNGAIRATMTELNENKPLSFTSMNGEVVLRVPAATKANVRIRTQNGSVLTDFDEGVLVTKSETSGTRSYSLSSGSLPPEAREAIREATRAGAEAMREAATAVKEAMQAAREGAEAARREAESSAAKASTGGAEVVPPKAPVGPKPPRAPKMPSIPTITGGTLVTGTLNGGGPEIRVATMNGDVTLRKLAN